AAGRRRAQPGWAATATVAAAAIAAATAAAAAAIAAGCGARRPPGGAGAARPDPAARRAANAADRPLAVPGAALRVRFAGPGADDRAARAHVRDWVHRSGEAVAAY